MFLFITALIFMLKKKILKLILRGVGIINTVAI